MFKYGEWEIEIDEKKTREYYSSLPENDTQNNRNFKKNIDLFNEEEKAFFNSFCVDLNKLDVDGVLVVSSFFKKKLYWGCNADIVYFGEVISAPKEESDTIIIGRFEFYIQNPENWEPGEEWPEDALYISMNSKLEWLLNEKCKEIEYENSLLSEHLKWLFYKHCIITIREKKEREKATATILDCFEKLGVQLIPFPKKKMLQYKKTWVTHYTDDAKIAALALPSRNVHNLLWHVFSFEEGKAIEGDDANACYDNTGKRNTVIYIDDIDTAFEAKNIDKLTSAEIEKICSDETLELGNMDIIITADDFSWTYCRTHESGWCGPYYYHL